MQKVKKSCRKLAQKLSRHEIAEEGTLVRRAVVDRAARGVKEAGVHGRVAVDPIIRGQKAKKNK